MPQAIWGFPNQGYIDAGNMPYTVYCVNLTSDFTDLIVQDLINTTPFTFTWARQSAGVYTVTASAVGAFEKASLIMGTGPVGDAFYTSNFDNGPNQNKVYVTTYNQSLGNNSDNQLEKTSFQIFIYP